MNKLFQLSLAALALLAALPAGAWNYKDGDVLLIFRESALPGTYPSPNNDVEFDLGSVTNFLGKPAGYTTAVTGWDVTKVQNVYGSDLTGVSVVLIAATSPTNASPTAYFSAALPQSFWLNGVEPYNTAYNVSPSVWQGSWAKINSIGTRPALYLPVSQQTASYSFSPSSILSYDDIVSSDEYVKAGAQNTIYADWLPQFGGFAPFTVEGVAPGSFGFLAVPSSTAVVKPLDTYLGTFTIDNLGNLTFTAGPPTPVIAGITQSGNTSTVSFSTGLSGNYSLVYADSLGGSSSWSVVGTPLVGDGNTNSLSYTSTDNNGFFRLVRSP
ncbi:MAG: hypothetical protein ABSH48_14010 [Verrucomicrobiota bacterium]|jgi:hypothetical protein